MRDPSSISPEDRKWLDKDLIEPVKIEYPEVILGSEPTTKTTINIDPRPIDQIVRDLADQRLVREQKDWDQRWGRDGIASLKRPEWKNEKIFFTHKNSIKPNKKHITEVGQEVGK